MFIKCNLKVYSKMKKESSLRKCEKQHNLKFGRSPVISHPPLS